MDKRTLYDTIAKRKLKSKDFEPYDGGNGRVNRCVSLVRSGVLRDHGTLLDVGGGIGDLGYALQDLFSRRIVLDISSDNLGPCKAKQNEVVCADVDVDGFLGIDDCSVDLVCALDFIEHIIDPENFAHECFRVLKPGGQVFINTPNIEFWRHLEKLVKYGVFPHTSGDREVYHGGHLAFYGLYDMWEIFGNDGFRLENITQLKDDEGYEDPPKLWVDLRNPKNQTQYVEACMRLGNPNLLVRMEKPK